MNSAGGGGRATKRSSREIKCKFSDINGERTVKARFGGGAAARKATTTTATTTTVVKGTREEVGEMEGDTRRRVVGDSLSRRPEIECSPGNLLEFEDWPSFWTALDEQMHWGSCWFPCLEKKYSSMDGLCGLDEILWEDDLWNLNSIKEIPTNP